MPRVAVLVLVARIPTQQNAGDAILAAKMQHIHTQHRKPTLACSQSPRFQHSAHQRQNHSKMKNRTRVVTLVVCELSSCVSCVLPDCLMRCASHRLPLCVGLVAQGRRVWCCECLCSLLSPPPLSASHIKPVPLRKANSQIRFSFCFSAGWFLALARARALAHALFLSLLQ